ncbi:MAG: glycosyltransferase family 39 protein [Rhizobiaceae bacterium]
MINRFRNWVRWVGEGKLGGVSASLALAALYALVQICVLTLVARLTGTATSIDDAEQLIYVPHLWAGYGGSQPPLFTWIFWGLAQLLGPNLLTLKILKYAILFLAFFAVHRALVLLGFSLLTASAGALGMMTMPQFFWESQHTLTHSVAAFGFSALAVLALVNLLQRKTTLSYVLFGAAAGLAMLSKFNDAIFIAALVIAAISLPALRPAILSRRIFLSLAAVLVMLTPTMVWSISNMDAVLARTRKLGIVSTGSFLDIRLAGLGSLGESIVNFTVVTIIIAAVAFAMERCNPFRPVRESTTNSALVGRIILVSLAIVVALMMISGTTKVPDRWLTPFLFLLPAWIAIRAERLGPVGGKVQVHFLASAILVAMLVMPVTWYKQAIGGSGKSRSARMDHAFLLKGLEKEGPVRTIIGYSSWIGNFRLVDPSLVLLNEEVPDFSRRVEEPAVATWLNQPCPPPHIWYPLRDVGYRFADRVSYVDVPESFGGTRRVFYVRLVKEGDPSIPPNGRLCSEWWLQPRR